MVTRFTAPRRVPRAISKAPALCVALAAALVAAAARPVLASPGHAKPRAVAVENAPAIRGVTIGPIESSQQSGRGYGTPYSAALLDALVDLGANAISITPFGRIWSLHSTAIAMDFEAPYAANREALARMVAQAKARGLRVLVIPHLWVETGGWRGEIDPGSEQGWRDYQGSYRSFVLAWARDAQAFGADAFSIGVECKSWSGRFGDYWQALIADVRAVFHGALTYSANWDEADGVLFWDQLDWIGVNAFYPLAHANGASDAEYVLGARAALDGLEPLARATGKPVVLVEIGYTTRQNAAVEPWLWPDTMQNVVVDEREQARALAAIAGAAAERPWIGGFYVWRYYANLDDVSQEAIWGFSPHAKQAERVLQQVFDARWAADPPLPWEAPPEQH
jgi:hypothetical protein